MSSCAFTLSLVLLVLLKGLLNPGLGVGMVLLHEVLGKIPHGLSSLKKAVSVVNYSLDNVHLALTGLSNPGNLARQVRVGLEKLFCRNDGSTGDQRGRNSGRGLTVEVCIRGERREERERLGKQGVEVGVRETLVEEDLVLDLVGNRGRSAVSDNMKADVLSGMAFGLLTGLSNDAAEMVEDAVVVTSPRRVIALKRQRNTRLQIRIGDLNREDRGNNSGGEVSSRVPLGNGVIKEEVNGVLAQSDKVDALMLSKASNSLDVLALGPSIGVVDRAEQVGAGGLEEVDDRLGTAVEIKLAGRGYENVRGVLCDGAGKLIPLVDGDVGGKAEVAHDVLHAESLVGEEDIELGAFLATEGVHEGSGDFVVSTGGLYEHNSQRVVGVLCGCLLGVAHP